MEGPPMPSPPPNWMPSAQPPPGAGTPQSNEKHVSRLPAVAYLDLEKIKKETQEYELKHPTTIAPSAPAPGPKRTSPPPPLPSHLALASPQSMYSGPPGPPPPYSLPSSATSSALGFGGYISPPDSRRLSDDDKEHQASRQSLPSIHEALGKDQSLLYSGPPPATSVSTQTSLPATAMSPTTPIPRSHPEPVLSGPPNPYASYQSSPYPPSEPPDKRSHPSLRTGSLSEEQPPSASRLPSHDPSSASAHHTPTSPVPPVRHSPRAMNAPQPPNLYHQSSQSVQPVQAPQPLPPQQSYPPPPPAYSYPPPPTHPLTYSNFQPPSTWRSDGFDIDRAEEARKAASRHSPANQPYVESVKRHLDIYDLETSLNEIAEGSGRALDFSKHHGAKAHQAQRSGPLSALPTLSECDDMIKRQKTVLAAMDRIREVVIAQQHALAEQRSRDEASRARQNELSEDSASFQEKQEGGGGFAGADPKKRRGRNAPPGRCHSCNRAETPEWRRGPDGARTLCNACGLHYAKLTRKMGSKHSIGSSNLRPKETGPLQ